MAIRPELAAALPNQGHFFNAERLRYRLTPAGPDHAQIAACAGIADYLETVAAHRRTGRPGGSPFDAPTPPCAPRRPPCSPRCSIIRAAATTLRLIGPAERHARAHHLDRAGRAGAAVCRPPRPPRHHGRRRPLLCLARARGAWHFARPRRPAPVVRPLHQPRGDRSADRRPRRRAVLIHGYPRPHAAPDCRPAVAAHHDHLGLCLRGAEVGMGYHGAVHLRRGALPARPASSSCRWRARISAACGPAFGRREGLLLLVLCARLLHGLWLQSRGVDHDQRHQWRLPDRALRAVHPDHRLPCAAHPAAPDRLALRAAGPDRHLFSQWRRPRPLQCRRVC